MKIAIPIYNDSVSNVFDFATRLLLVEIENGKEANRSEVALESQLLPQRTDKLKNLEVDVLVCGAISRVLANMVATSGIQVLPYVTGSIDDVLQAYLAGQLVKPEFVMPGCWPGARKGFGRRQRGRCGHRRRRGRLETGL
ncbi:NifB/NifX family molybdenum-iron cluster-binding protein [Planctomycetota bacterium]